MIENLVLEMWPADRPENLIMWDRTGVDPDSPRWGKIHFEVRNSESDVRFNLELTMLNGFKLSDPVVTDYGAGPVTIITANRNTN